MPWYVWVFDGIGAAIVVPLIGWVITRFQQKRLALSAGDISQSNAQQATANSPAPPLTSGPGQPSDAPRRPPAPEQPSPTDLVDLLLAIPGMTDPAFRQRLYEHLPRDVAQQLHLESRAARLELISLIDTFAEYPHLSPWESLLGRLEQLLPAHQGVQLLAAELARRGLT
jgi:Effector-associated domain 2